MSTILVVDDAPICREPIAAALRQQGYHTLEAGGGDEALTLLREQKPDLMLLDLSMPHTDGLAVLRAVRRNPALRRMPVIVLTDRGDREHVVLAAERGVQGYLLKSRFSLNELCRRVEFCLGGGATPAIGPSVAPVEPPEDADLGADPARSKTPAEGPTVPSRSLPGAKSLDDLQPIITRNDLIRLVNEGLELRPLGPVVGQVAATAGSPNCSAEALAKVVMQDQALSIRLLKLANSSAYARGRSVESVKEAVQRIGANEVRSLVMTLGVVERYQGKAAEHVDPRMFWEHSIACGLIAASLAEAVKAPNVDDCFLWGLLHDVGRIIMLDHVPEAYAAVFQAAEALDLPLELIEPRLMLLDHCKILERALEFWQFPRSFIVPVANHHLSLARIKRLGPQHEKPTIAVALADRLAHALLLGGSGNDVVYPIDELVEALGIQASVLRRIEENVITEGENLKLVMLAKAADEPWPDFRDATRQKLARPATALFVSKDPQIDSFRIVFERLAPHGVGSPPAPGANGGPPDDDSTDDAPGREHSAGDRCADFNLGVVHLTNQNEQAPLLERFTQAEKDAGRDDLPLLIITGKGGLADDQPLPTRRHRILSAPVRLDRLVATVNELLSA